MANGYLYHFALDLLPHGMDELTEQLPVAVRARPFRTFCRLGYC